MEWWSRGESLVCVCAVGEFGVIDNLDTREVNAWSAGSVSTRRRISNFHFQLISPFDLYHLYECNALSVKNVERIITLWWSKAWDDVFFFCFVFKINPRCSISKSCNSRASTSGVDIFNSVFVFRSFFFFSADVKNLCRSKCLECIRAEESFFLAS